jgi:hypothetical protein
MRKFFWALVALVALVPLSLYSAQIVNSFMPFPDNNEVFQEYQMIRLDIGDDIGVADGQAYGGTAASDNDYTRYVDARGFTQIALYVFEYGDGSTTGIKLWDCLTPVGLANSAFRGTAAVGRDGPLSGIGTLGTEAPTASPGKTDPDPLCVDITAGAGVTIIGTTAGVQKFVPARQPFSFLVVEIDDCTGECDMSIHLVLNR